MASSHSNNSFIRTKTFDRCLGNGAYGIVLKANNQSRKPTAVKFIFPTEVDSKEQERIYRECKLTKELQRHDNVVRVIDIEEKLLTAADLENIFSDTILNNNEEQLVLRDSLVGKAKRKKTIQSICIEMELCGETLRQWINEHQSRPQVKVEIQASIIKNLVSGLKHLHDNKIIHRDLKPENVMFAKSGYRLPVKIGDFGLCRRVHSEESQTRTLTSRAGTLDYMAPEVFGNIYSLQADLYSLGLVIWEVAQVIPSLERKILFDRLVNDKDEGVVVEHSDMTGVREVIIGLTKRKNEDRIKNIDCVMGVAASWDHLCLTGSELIAKNEDELKLCLKNVNKGGTIQLVRCEYVGVFHLEQNNVKIRGVDGSVLKLLEGNDIACLTIFCDGCRVSNVAIITGMENTGIKLLGSKNKIKNVKFVAGFSLYVRGHENLLKNLNISNARTGISIRGFENTVEGVELESVWHGITLDLGSSKNSLSNINGRNVGCGIEVHGILNNISKVNLIKNSTEHGFSGVSLYCDSNWIKNLTCSGYERSKDDWGLTSDSGCSVENSECGPVLLKWHVGSSTLTNVECGELIKVDSDAVNLINCRGNKLEVSGRVKLSDCNFDIQVLPNLWRRLRNTKLFQ